MRHLIVWFVLFLSVSCNERGKDGFVETTYYSDGITVYSMISYLKDTIKHGPAKTFYPNGQLAEEGIFKNGKKDGPYTVYYRNGMIKEQGNTRLGVPLGSFSYYYLNGQLELYNAQDYKEVFYVLKFDSLGQKIREEGRVIGLTKSSPTYKIKYVVGDNMVIEYCIAEPPGYIVNVKAGCYLKSMSEKEQLLDTFKPIFPISQLATYRLNLYKPGTYNIVCVGELSDTNQNFKIIDTSFTEIIVN